MRVLFTDYKFKDIEIESALFRDAGIELVTAQCKTEDDVIAASEDCQGLLIQYAPAGAKLFAARPDIAIASRIGVGYDVIDLAAAKAAGVWVANSPDYGVGEVATHALAMVLTLIRHIPFYDRDVRNGTYHYTSAGRIRRASDMTLGILGLGRIGKRMAHVGRNCFRKVIACDPYIIDGDLPAYVERVDLMQLFRDADAISIHVPLNDETRGMVNSSVLNIMKPTSVLVNTARGAVINVDDLVLALEANRLDGVGLDVLPIEPPPRDHPLLNDPRVLLTPHAAFYSVESECELRRKAAQNLIDWRQRGRPTYVVVQGTK